MDWDFELVAGPYGGTSEGPVWDGEAMLFTDIPNSRIMQSVYLINEVPVPIIQI